MSPFPVPRPPSPLSMMSMIAILFVMISVSSVSCQVTPTIWDVMSKNGCGRFANLVGTTGNASAAYAYHSSDVDDGLTIFCPADTALKDFEPIFRQHKAAAQLNLLLYHGLPAHYSIQALKVNNGLLATLDTDASLFVENDGDNVTLASAANELAVVVRTVMDANRVVVHRIDAVLLTNEFARFGANAPSGGNDGGMEGNQKNGVALLFASTGVIASLVFAAAWASATF